MGNIANIVVDMETKKSLKEYAAREGWKMNEIAEALVKLLIDDDWNKVSRAVRKKIEKGKKQQGVDR